ncbi:hypothetical protein IB642_02500, partial [Allofrancisella guangzhouensis]|nr:hypothetical protein [Allofrancisella guangzhouensis]MBK2045003.1 hypothetical protein [Allofrancisella guangzhouensis]
RVWDLTGHTNSNILGTYPGGVCVLELLPDGRLVSGSNDGTIMVWDLYNPATPPIVLKGHKGRIQALELLPDGRIASSAYGDNSIIIW